MTTISPMLSSQVDKTVSCETNKTQTLTNANNIQTLKNDSFTKSDKVKIGLTSLAGGAVGAGTGLFSSYNLWEKTMKNLQAGYGESSLDKKLVDTLGELVIKHLQGEKITGREGSHFFDSKLRPPETVAMEEFIKNNNLTSSSNPKEVKKLLKEYVAKDETMKEHIANLKNTISYTASAGGFCETPFAMAKTSDSLFLKKLGSVAIKKYAVITATAVALGAAVVGGVTALILKQKNKSNSSQV